MLGGISVLSGLSRREKLLFVFFPLSSNKKKKRRGGFPHFVDGNLLEASFVGRLGAVIAAPFWKPLSLVAGRNNLTRALLYIHYTETLVSISVYV